MELQLSMFDMLNQYETPEIPPEMQKQGVKGWIIEGSGIFLRENGFDHDWRGVCTRPIIFEKDTYKDRQGRWCQWAHTTKGPYTGWCGGMKRIFRDRPSWADCLRWATENYHAGDPQEVGYYEIIGDWAGAKYEWCGGETRMTKKQVIKGAILLIEKIAKDKGLTVVNNGTGHAFDHTFWAEIMKDDSGIPNVEAKGEGYSIELRSFWGSPEVDVRRIGKFGEELLIFNYSDSEEMEGDTEYKHTGCFLVQQVRVEAKWDYKACIKEVFDMIELLEVFARKEDHE